MSTPEDRERLARELERRGLLPSEAEQLEYRAEACAVARRACHLRGAERERSEALEARFRQLAVRAKTGEPIVWPDE